MVKNASADQQPDRSPPMNGRPVLGQFGTFDVENYGDLVYPVLFKRMFHQRDGNTEIQKFSLMGGKSLQDSGYHSRPIRQLFSTGSEKPHTLVVGGGDLLRTDWNLVASHYRSICLQQNRQSPLFSWRRLFKKRLTTPMDADREFRLKYMNYPAVGPFIIGRNGSSTINSVAYCSCGVPFGFDESVRRQVASTFDKSIFIYVRDEASKNALIRAGVTREIHVAPDLVVVLSDFFDAAAERERGRDILRKHGVDIRRRILCFQSNPQPPERDIELVKQLKAYQLRAGCEVVFLPLGWCHGDREYLKRLAQDSGGAFKYVELDSIFEIIAVLAACDVFLGTSLH